MDPGPGTKTRVAVVASQVITAAALRTLLASASRFEPVGEEDEADVILIDARPNTDPAPIVSAAASGHAAIVVLLDDDDLAQCSAAIAAGAAGLVGRQHSPQALFAAIDRVHAGETAIERAILSRVVRQSRSPEVAPDPCETLSKRECEVHALVTQGLRNKEIAERLFISEATVRHHLTAIFGKLGVSGRLELLARGSAFQNSWAPAPTQNRPRK